jgi:hypothetical protein
LAIADQRFGAVRQEIELPPHLKPDGKTPSHPSACCLADIGVEVGTQ